MPYFTKALQSRGLTEQELLTRDTYITEQINAGTTDGVRTPTEDNQPASNPFFRTWTTQESANGFSAILEGFNPPVPVEISQ